jgi:hypothetical protein
MRNLPACNKAAMVAAALACPPNVGGFQGARIAAVQNKVAATIARLSQPALGLK